MRYRPLAAALAALSVHPVQAAEPAIPMQEVVVTGQRLGVSSLHATRLSQESLTSLRAATSDSAALLANVPGVSLMGAGGVSSLPVIHGLGDDRLRVVVDGMDLIASCPNHMNPALSYLDPSQVGSVRVYAGIAPVSQGGDSLGGSIVVDSVQPRFNANGADMTFSGAAGASYRSNGNATSLNLNATAANDRMALSYAGASARADNYRAGADFKTQTATGRSGHTLALDEVGSTAYESVNHTLGVALRGGDRHRVDMKLSYQHIPYENFPNQRMDMTDNRNDRIKLGYTGVQPWGQVKAQVWYEHTAHAMDFGADKRYWYGTASGGPTALNGAACSPISATCAAGMPMYSDGTTLGASASAEIARDDGGLLRLGAEVLAYRLDDWWSASGANMWPGTFWNINDGRRDRIALFGEWEGRLGRGWSAQAGLRHELVDMDSGAVRGYDPTSNAMGSNQQIDGDAFNARNRAKTDHNWDLTALARYEPDPTQNLEMGLARKTRSPNLYQRYTWSTWSMAATMNNFLGDGNGYVGEIDLKPEVAHTLSLTGDWHDAARQVWEFKATPYYTYVQDYIDARCNGTCTTRQFNVLKYVNQDARLYGLDLSARYVAAPATAWGSFTVTGQASYTRGKNTETQDNLYNIMPFNGKLALTRKQGAWSNTLEGVFVAGKDKVSQVRNEIVTGGYSLLHFRSSYGWKQVRLDFGVENLLDKAHALPLGGAYLGQGTTMAMNPTTTPQWGTAVPGPGRSFYAGFNVKF